MRAPQCWGLAVLALLVGASLPAKGELEGSPLGALGHEGGPPSPDEVRRLKRQRAAPVRSQGAAPVRQGAGPAATVASATSTIADCSKGKSLQAAIDAAEDGDVVEVRGLCHENVRVERKAITLRGGDPAVDGIRGVAPAPGAAVNGALVIAYSDGARVENLSVESSPAAGVAIYYSHVTMQGCRVSANSLAGVHASGDSFLDAQGLEVAGNGGAGITAQRAAAVFCSECEVSGNTNFAGNASLGGFLTLLDSTVAGTRGISASNGAYADVDCVSVESTHPCTLEAVQVAARATDRSAAVLLGVEEFTGQLVAADHAHLSTLESTQLSTGVNAAGLPRPNFAEDFSTLWIESGRLKGQTVLAAFARGLLDSATLDGSLTCQDAADAVVRNGLTLTPGSAVTGCEHAP